jgi:protein SCO1
MRPRTTGTSRHHEGIVPRLSALLVLALLAAGCGAGTAATPETPPQKIFRGSELTPPLATAPFALHDQDGKRVRWADQRGRYVVVAFLYTQCPDVCPLIAANLNRALAKLTPAERSRVRVLSVSVDPEGDTPAAVRRYVAQHRLLPQFRWLTGTRAQLVPVWRSWHVGVNPGKLDTVDHSAYELLVDPEGRGRVLYDAGVQWDDVLHDLRVLMHE